MTFEECFAKLMELEGGYSDHAADPGGKTRYGITEVVARENGYRGDMRDLPIQFAMQIYRDRYWNLVHADKLPDEIRFAVFDAAVNSGTRQSARWLQRAVGVEADGKIGPITITASWRADPHVTVRKLACQRLRFMADLSNWQHFGRGWARRICDILET